MITLSITGLIAVILISVFPSALFTFLLTAFAKEQYIDKIAGKEKQQENYRLKKMNQELLAENDRLKRQAEDMSDQLDEIERTFAAREMRKRSIA